MIVGIILAIAITIALVRINREVRDLQQTMNRQLNIKKAPLEATRQTQIKALVAVSTTAPTPIVTPPPKVVYAPVYAAVTYTSVVLQKIKYCESGGNYAATNGTHFGAYQFDVSTWNSYGPHVTTGLEIQQMAPAIQDAAALAAFNVRGTSPWLASEHCWG